MVCVVFKHVGNDISGVVAPEAREVGFDRVRGSDDGDDDREGGLTGTMIFVNTYMYLLSRVITPFHARYIAHHRRRCAASSGPII